MTKNQTGKSASTRAKAGRYLKYALGEIILVIIGILFALQINNWNQHRNNMKKLETYILQYKKELQQSIIVFKAEKSNAEFYLNQNIKLLQIKDYEPIPVDSLEAWRETFYMEFDPDYTVYESLKNSQITDFGKYESIVSSLQSYYTQFCPYAKMAFNNHNLEVDKADRFWRNEQDVYELDYGYGPNYSMQTPEQRKTLLTSLLKHTKARNILKIDSRKKQRMIKSINSWITFHEDRLENVEMALNLKGDD